MKWGMKESHNRRLLGICVLSILSLILLSPTPSVAQVELDDLTGVTVAIYTGEGVMPSSHIALTRMFEWMSATVVNVTASQILDDFLDDCDMLVVPGGSESTCLHELQFITGVQKIKDFVANGGSYFGICGGSTFGANSVNLFDGELKPVLEPGDLIHMTTLYTNQSSTGPDLSDCPANFTTMYYASQYFAPNPATSVYIIANYQPWGRAAMIASEYGNGTYFLSSPHPEYEEDSDRDDTTFGDDLNDPDSEWDLLFKVSKWLIDASYVEPANTSTTPATTILTTNTTTNTTQTIPLDLPLVAGASAGIVVVVLTVAVLYRRMHG
ncbi:MAG: BPL-N domain-containing protein [Candidatus Thorarchaeota archaeon]